MDKKDRGKGSKIRHRCQLKDAGHHFEEEEGEKRHSYSDSEVLSQVKDDL